MADYWYVLHVKPHKERPVFNLLEAEGREVYYPALKVKPVNPRSRRERPFFPGYLFVKLDLDAMGSNALRWTEGTHGLVEFGGSPATVPEYLIVEIRQRLSELHEWGQDDRDRFDKGDRIRITDGVFEGYEAIFDARLPGKKRAHVLLTFLHDHPKRLELDLDQIIKIEEKRYR